MTVASIGERAAWALAWPARRPLATVLLALGVAGLSALAVSRMRAEASLEAMFSRDNPAAAALTRVMNDFPAADELIVLVTAPQPDPQRLETFGQRLEREIATDPHLASMTSAVLYRVDPESRAFVEKVIGPNGLFYLDDTAFEKARQRLTPEGIRAQVRRDAALIATPGPAAGAMAKALLQDPLRLHEFILDRLAAQRPFKTYQGSEVFLSPDGRSLLVRVLGTRPPSDLDFSNAFTRDVAAAADRVNVDHFQVEHAGAYASTALAARAIRGDMIASVIGSVVLMQALFVLAYRAPIRSFALALGPVALGILIGLAAYATVRPHLTPLTAVLGAVLAGMGIDYSIQYLSFYETQRGQGAAPREAAERGVGTILPAILAAWATSVIGFVAIGSSSVKALRDFSIIGALGLTGAFLCAVTVLPALLVLTDRRQSPAAPTRLRFSTGPLLGGIRRAGGVVLTASLVMFLAAAALLAASGDPLPLESDLTVMHPRPNPPLLAQQHLTERFGISPSSLIVYLRAADPQRLVALAYDVHARVATDACRGAGVSETYGLATLLPDPRLVASRVTAVKATDVDRVLVDLRAALNEEGFNLQRFQPYFSFLRELLGKRSAPGVEALVPYRHLAETMLPASAFSGHAPAEAISILFVNRSLDERAARDEAVRAARQALAGLPGVTVTGLSVLGHDTEQTVHSELPRLTLVAILLVAVYLLIHFRNLIDAGLALLPTVFSLVVLAAAMHVLGQRLNLINLIAIPLLVGIDVDYGIFLVNAARRRVARTFTGEALSRRIDPACHAVIMCATATMLGFGSLVTTSLPAVRSLGAATGLGIAACLAAVLLVVVPLLFRAARAGGASVEGE